MRQFITLMTHTHTNTPTNKTTFHCQVFSRVVEEAVWGPGVASASTEKLWPLTFNSLKTTWKRSELLCCSFVSVWCLLCVLSYGRKLSRWKSPLKVLANGANSISRRPPRRSTTTRQQLWEKKTEARWRGGLLFHHQWSFSPQDSWGETAENG